MIPSVVLNATHLFPESWTDEVIKYIVVATALVALLVRAPRVSAGIRRNERTVSMLVAVQLATLAVYLFLVPFAELDRFAATNSLVAWLWLAVPVAGVLLADVEPTQAEVSQPLWRRRLEVATKRLRRVAASQDR